MSTQALLAELPRLTFDELRQIKARVDFLLGSEVALVEQEQDWLIQGIYFELRRLGLAVYTSNQDKKKFFRDCDFMGAYLLQKIGMPLKPAEKQELGRIVARALTSYLEPRVAIGFHILSKNIDKIPAAMEASYPRYLASGMIGLLVGHPPDRTQGR